MGGGLNLFDHGGDEEVVRFSSESSSSYPLESELELGLGLSIGGGVVKTSTNKPCRILTSKNFSSSSSSSGTTSVTSSPIAVVGTKRGADEVALASGNGVSQVVGWPPVRAHRIKSLADHRSVDAEIDKIEDYMNKKKEDSTKNHIVREKIHQGDSLFVKVNRDGDPIGRKVDVCAHACYETLAKALEEMFDNPTTSAYSICSTCDNEHGVEVTKPSKLLKGSSDFALTYEDKDGDLMLAGDVPWRMFLTTVKKLRIQRKS